MGGTRGSLSMYRNKSEVQLILCWISDNQILRMDFGQSLSDQHSETTPNSVCPTFWKSVCDVFLRTPQREHGHNLVSDLVYLRYLQVLLYLRGEWHGLPSRSTRFTLYSVILEELSTYRYSRLKISLCLLLVLDRFISFPTVEFILDDHISKLLV